MTVVASIYAAVCVTITLATGILTLRLVSRTITKNKFWLDDYFAIAAWIFAIGYSTCMFIWISHGLGQHIDDVAGPQETTLYYAYLLNWVLDLLYAFSLICSKLSLLALYWRLFSITSIRYPIWILVVLSVIWVLARIGLNIFMCIPVQGAWDKSIESTCYFNGHGYYFGSMFPHLLLDIAILCLPIWQVSQLRLERLPKAGLYFTFVFGGFVCIASIVVLVPSFNYDEKALDVTFNNVNMFIWATVEVNLSIVAGSFPMIGGIIVRMVKGHSSTSNLGLGNAGGSPTRPSWPSYRLKSKDSNDVFS